MLDAQGRSTDTLGAGEGATLLFSWADWTDDSDGVLDALVGRRDATRVSYRMTGGVKWQALEVVLERSEHELGADLGHFPTGDFVRVDLSPATKNAPNRLIDLRIEFEDASGNRTTWTQSPALMIGSVPVPPKRRSVR